MNEQQIRRYLRFIVPIVVGLIIGALKLFGIKLLPGVFGESFTNALPWLVPGLQAATIAVLLGFWRSDPQGLTREGDTANAADATSQFYVVWLLLWICFIVYYALAALNALQPTMQFLSPFGGDALHILSSALIVLCYLVMTLDTTPGIARLMHYATMTAVGCIVLLIARVFAGDDSFAFQTVLGLIAAIALGLFTGRLESPYIGASRILIVVLYGYAALQMAYPLLARGSTEEVTIYGLVFPAKVVLYLVVQDALVSGRLTHYMYGYRQLKGELETKRTTFLLRAFAPGVGPNKKQAKRRSE